MNDKPRTSARDYILLAVVVALFLAVWLGVYIIASGMPYTGSR